MLDKRQIKQEPRCRYISMFTAASRGFHGDSNAFELNKSPD